MVQYNKTNWQNGDLITADLLNNMENGIESISNGAMERVPIKLVKNGSTFKITDWNNANLPFNTLKNTLKDVTKYVVMVYGNSKLRPQYVSDSEIIFIGLTEDSTGAKILIEDSTVVKILRVVYTPSRCSYTATELVKSDMLEDALTLNAAQMYNINYIGEYNALQTEDSFILPINIVDYDDVYIELYNPISSVTGAYLYVNDIFEDISRVFVGSFTDRSKPYRRIIHLKRVNINYFLLETWGSTVTPSATSLECTNISSVPSLVKLTDGAPTLTAGTSGCFTQGFTANIYAYSAFGGGGN